MPLYEYRCPEKHVTEIVRGMKDVHPKSIKCRTCKKRAHRLFSTPAVQDDFPEHVSTTFGCVVKNRQHHRALQKLHGCHDYEHNSSTGSQMVQERLRK